MLKLHLGVGGNDFHEGSAQLFPVALLGGEVHLTAAIGHRRLLNVSDDHRRAGVAGQDGRPTQGFLSKGRKVGRKQNLFGFHDLSLKLEARAALHNNYCLFLRTRD